MRRTALTVVALATVALHSAHASEDRTQDVAQSADEKKQCVTDYVAGQRSRNARDFVTAKKHFLACAQVQCHANIRKDCATWLSEVGQDSSSIVIAAQYKGIDVTAVRVYLDENLLTDGLDGRALEVNPGKHTLRFESDTYEKSEQVVLIREGERNRGVAVSLRKIGEGSSDSNKSYATYRKDVPVLSYILGGVGVAGVGMFAGFGLKGMNGKSELDRLACKPNCDATKTASIKRDFVVADVGLAIGIASLGTAAILLFTRGYEQRLQVGSTKMRLDLSPIAGGGAATVSGQF